MTDQLLGMRAVQSASVTGLFTLNGLCKALNLPEDDLERRDTVWRTLAEISDESVPQPGLYCWKIYPDARRAALAQFYSRPHLDGFMAQASVLMDGKAEVQDPFGHALNELLTGARISFDDPGHSADLASLKQAITRAAAILDAAQFVDVVPALEGHAFQVRVGVNDTYVAMVLPKIAELARAHIKDLQARSDIRIVLPNRHFGYGPQRDQISAFAKGQGGKYPLLLTGIGGAGKSALLSRQMLAWQRSTPEMIQVLLDFDRRQLALGEPIEIVQEIFRQISAHLRLRKDAAYDELRSELGQLRTDIGLYKQDSSGGRASNSVQLSYAFSHLRQLHLDWAKPLTDIPIVLVLDTFEAIDRMSVFQRQFTEFAPETSTGNEVVSQIMSLLHTLQQDFLPNVRVIVSGREEPLSEDELNQWFGTRVRLEGLHPVSGANLLRNEMERLNPARSGVFASDAKARTVSKLLGGHPLAIIAFAKYAEGNPGDVDALISELAAEGGFAAEFAQVFLYTRILNRITDAEVRPLAHPGLMLRSIDADIILNVLAGPCLGRGADSENPLTAAEAEALFLRLRNQYWLVEPVNGDAGRVRHIPELRRLMVPGLLAGPGKSDTDNERSEKEDLRNRAMEVCAAAAAYFKARDSDTDRLNALYYGAFSNPPPPSFETNQAADFDRYLGDDIATLPADWRAVIKHLLDRDLTEDETKALPKRYQADESRRAMGKIRQTGTRTSTKSRSKAELDTSDALLDEQEKSAKRPRPKVRKNTKRAWSELSLLEQSQLLLTGWDNPSDELAEQSEWFLEALAEAQVQIQSGQASGDLAKTLQLLDTEALRDPFGSSVYLSTTLKLAESVDLTSQLPSSNGPDVVSEPLWAQGLAMAQVIRKGDVIGAAQKLRNWFATVRGRNAIAVHRLEASRIAGLAITPAEEKGGDFVLDMRALSLAAGQYENFEQLYDTEAAKTQQRRPSFALALEPLWEEARTGNVYLSYLERFYRLDERVPVEPGMFDRMTHDQRHHFAAMLRGLNPELYRPATALLSRLDFHAGEAAVLATAYDLALWPIDLAFDDQNLYDPSLASAVVETADRCGALRPLLQNIAKHEPFANRLISIHDLTTNVFFPEIKDYLSGPPDQQNA